MSTAPATRPRHVHVEHVMGTAVTFDVRGGVGPHRAIDDAVRWLHAVDATFSTYRPAVCRFDRGSSPSTRSPRTCAG